jgi:hypothetical protein
MFNVGVQEEPKPGWFQDVNGTAEGIEEEQ